MADVSVFLHGEPQNEYFMIWPFFSQVDLSEILETFRVLGIAVMEESLTGSHLSFPPANLLPVPPPLPVLRQDEPAQREAPTAETHRLQPVGAPGQPNMIELLKQREAAARHLRIHSGEMPFKFSCHLCPKRFNCSYALNRHRELHSQGKKKPFPCTTCLKSFRTKYHLTRHKLIHILEPEKPFSCHLCSKRFNRSYTWKKHMKVHYPSNLGDNNQSQDDPSSKPTILENQVKKKKSKKQMKLDEKNLSEGGCSVSETDREGSPSKRENNNCENSDNCMNKSSDNNGTNGKKMKRFADEELGEGQCSKQQGSLSNSSESSKLQTSNNSKPVSPALEDEICSDEMLPERESKKKPKKVISTKDRVNFFKIFSVKEREREKTKSKEQMELDEKRKKEKIIVEKKLKDVLKLVW